ncbi:hypothetical protein OF83DRAFT_1172651 [Amylostereum chailletii]|nr:hypothetical protein OF83DRAFT_1172651 [Amylostereum chailletii]
MTSLRSGRAPAPGGLPSGPRSSSVSRLRGNDNAALFLRSGRAEPPPSLPSTARTVRPQRSLANLPSHTKRQAHDPMPAPPTLSLRTTVRRQTDEGKETSRAWHRPAHSDSSSIASSPTTSDSSSSKFRFGPSWARSETSSARTSLDEDSMTSKPTYSGGVRDDDGTATGAGYSLWGRITEAASSLTVSVGQAWAYNVAADTGEVTPPGEDSHLTRVMKAYHLEKARSPADLPSWLFSTDELRAAGARSSTSSSGARREDNYERTENMMPPSTSSRGLRNIYDAAAATPTRSVPDLVQRTTTVSKANDRLKAMRDAKRNVTRRPESSGSSLIETDMDDGRDSSRGRGNGGREVEERSFERPLATPTARAPAKMGLPTRPGARRV